MKSKSIFKVLPVAAALAATLGAGNAHADAYALSFDEITNFLIITSPLGLPIGSSNVNSAATACLPNGSCVSTGGAGTSDAAPAQIGVVRANNDYTPVGTSVINYSRADASIDSRQTQGDAFTRSRNLAEGYIVSSTTATATAGNSSGTVLTVPVTVSAPGAVIFFSFDLDPLMRVFLNPGALNPSQADASIAVSFSINQVGGGQVFNWAMDGAPGGITGGTEVRDPFSANTSILALPGATGPFVYDPASCPVGTVFGDGLHCFLAFTNPLPVGTYVINLAMRETINLQNTAAVVPEPATLGLLGLGLGMLGFVGRRRRAS